MDLVQSPLISTTDRKYKPREFIALATNVNHRKQAPISFIDGLNRAKHRVQLRWGEIIPRPCRRDFANDPCQQLDIDLFRLDEINEGVGLFLAI